jgi:hypothetical protein
MSRRTTASPTGLAEWRDDLDHARLRDAAIRQRQLRDAGLALHEQLTQRTIVDDLEQRASLDGIRRQAQHLANGAVGQQDEPAQVHRDDGVRGAAEHAQHRHPLVGEALIGL